MGNCTSKESTIEKKDKKQQSAREKGKAEKKKRKGGLLNDSNKPSSSHHHNNGSKESNDLNNVLDASDEQNDQNSLYPSQAHELRWKFLYTNYASKIVDPADIHCVLDECLKETIHKLHSAEMTLLSRRVRKVVRKLLISDNHSSNYPNNAAIGLHGGGGGGAGGNHQSHMGNKKKSGITSNMGSPNKSKSNKKIPKKPSNSTIDPNIPLELLSPAVAEARSKQIYQKEFVLDEFLMRQIFIGGNQILYLGSIENWGRQSLEMYLRRKIQKKNKAVVGDGSNTGGDGSENGSFHGKSGWIGIVGSFDDTIDELIQEQLHNLEGNGEGNGNRSNVQPSIILSPSRRIGRRRMNQNRSIQSNGQHQNGHEGQKDNSSATSVANIFGNAFQILLHLSEKRWDHFANIARLSADKANLVLDVNEQTRIMEERKEQNTSSSPLVSISRSPSSLPLPPPENPSEENYNDLPPQQTLPNGITLQEISFLVATALRGSRNRRLVLLFHLLLKRDTLVDVLKSHPGGGVPTWLLEVDSDWILSYASLSHYFYYGGIVSPYSQSPSESTSSSQSSNNLKSFFSSSKSPRRSSNGEDSTPAKELKVDTLCAIETIALLLHHSPKKTFNTNDVEEMSQTTKSRKEDLSNKPSRSRTLSYSDKKYHSANMHLMLSDYLRKIQQNPSEAPMFENDAEQFRKFEMMDKFWDISQPTYSKCKKLSNNCNTSKDTEMSWTIEDFIKWADQAIPDDSYLDHIMHQLFGLGLLPTHAMERRLVCESWVDWQMKESRFFDFPTEENYDAVSVMTLGIKNLLTFPSSIDDKVVDSTQPKNSSEFSSDDDLLFLSNDESAIWGGIGGFDGRGGLGYGLMYCIDKTWWDDWASYVGWEWSDGDTNIVSRNRPLGLNTENLIEQSPKAVVRGILGSYEFMKKGLKKDVDYVLVPPRVWDILYELYGGGPPLPRMIIKISKVTAENSSIDVAPYEKLVEKPMRVPKALNVLTHPWMLECRVCDPHQPYRRGEIGLTSIRVMVSPDQYLWRLFSELIVRLPIIHSRGENSIGRGCARLWRRVEHEENSENKKNQTYGPWELLFKSGSAEFPVSENINIDGEIYQYFKNCWETYTCNKTVESIGISDGDMLLFEYALVGKDNNFTWPREAAAEAGKQHRDIMDDKLFRRKLRGLDKDGKLMRNNKALIGTVIDAMDSSGRWYQAEITDIDNSSKQSKEIESDDETCASETCEESVSVAQIPGEVRAIRVDFSDVGGEEEWILVNSDRLAVRERFTLDSMKSVDQLETGKSSNQSKAYSLVLRKNSSKKTNTFQPISLGCSYPGFGACGLYNLGNTCYSNSALQCITYLPLLRAYLLSGQFKKNGDLNRENPLGTGGKVLEEFAELLRGMWSGKSGSLQPLRFRHCLVRAKDRYAGTEQQDAQELLNDILDILHEDSNKIFKKPYVEAIEDAWVSKSDLFRVGDESWRRYMRRNRSIIANLCMGQVLNRVTYSSKNNTSRIFEPFNMLSLPFPKNVLEVFFRCIVIRRASVLNCSESFISTDRMRSRFKSLPKHNIAEEYMLPMSRVADISELKVNLVKICEIPVERLKVYTITNGSVEDIANSTMSFALLEDNNVGPCWQFSQRYKDDESTNSATTILAFESTLALRPDEIKSPDNYVSKELKKESNDKEALIDETLRLYGDDLECRLYDTNPSVLSRAISHIMWPHSALDFVRGLRVDAIDQRNQWFPGTIVEVVNSGINFDSNQNTSNDPGFHVKVHFDNFSTKWDLSYSLEDIRKGSILPLYSRAIPKESPFEIQLFHSQHNGPFNFFGLPFFAHFFVEWTNARAGAHILAQTTRFLGGEEQTILFRDNERMQFSNKYTRNAEIQKNIKEGQNAISKAIDVLVDADRKYMNLILRGPKNGEKQSMDKVSMLKAKLEKKMSLLIPLLPFDIVIYDKAYLSKANKNKGAMAPFQFKLDRTIGNCMNARQEIVICWKEVNRSASREIVSYHSPLPIDIHEESHENMKKKLDHMIKINGGSDKLGLNLSSCLNEFCDEQQLDETEGLRCPKSKELQEGTQRMKLWRLPDILIFHLKRFNSSARWLEKVTNKVNFPLTGLNMKEWCDEQSPPATDTSDDCIYDLIGVVNHYGGMTSGHYTAVTKASACSPEGSEEVEHYFNGAGVHAFGGNDEKEVQSSLWKLIRSKEKDASNIQARAAQAYAKATADSCEPLWLHFDDESVEPISPSEVISSTAYVLFYRRRRITPSNIARYSTVE